ncbi:Oxysterol-binding protein OBPa [Savitreella phatthalungensis]
MTKEDAAETALEDDQKSIIMGIIGQLRPGMDLSRITLPTFILEPKSMLERITNFMAHPELLMPIPELSDPVARFVEVVRFYMAGWHIRPPGVKKPLNPILGEVFSGYWTIADGTQALYLAEQVSHHPPISAYCYYCPEHKIRIDGLLKPRSKFLGNSAGSIMEGEATLRILNHDELYTLTQPNMYARGILFGRMRMELGDHSMVKCEQSDLVADIEFKTKGFISGKYDTIGGCIKRLSTGERLFELDGKWTEQMTIKNLKTKKVEPFFDGMTAKETPISTKPIELMGERESRRLWKNTIDAIKARDQAAATQFKGDIEDAQREEARRRHEAGEHWSPSLFRKTGDEEYSLNAPADLQGTDLKNWMEAAVGGITDAQQAGSSATKGMSPTRTASAHEARPGSAPQGGPTNSATKTPVISGNSPLRPQPGASPQITPGASHLKQSAASSTHAANALASPSTPKAQAPDAARPKLSPVDSEDQMFEDAQEHFSDMHIR